MVMGGLSFWLRAIDYVHLKSVSQRFHKLVL